jgi:amino acid transporter
MSKGFHPDATPSAVSSKNISEDKSPAVETITEQVDVQDGIIIEDGLRRGLLARHVTLISLASVIGASCFYGFGYALYLSGPLGALIGFGIVGKLPDPSYEVDRF